MGMASGSAVSLGMNASSARTMPMYTPTFREATPVISARGMLEEYVVLGTVPATPESRLPTPSAATAPCTVRKSTARSFRQETR